MWSMLMISRANREIKMKKYWGMIWARNDHSPHQKLLKEFNTKKSFAPHFQISCIKKSSSFEEGAGTKMKQIKEWSRTRKESVARVVGIFWQNKHKSCYFLIPFFFLSSSYWKCVPALFWKRFEVHLSRRKAIAHFRSIARQPNLLGETILQGPIFTIRILSQ